MTTRMMQMQKQLRMRLAQRLKTQPEGELSQVYDILSATVHLVRELL